MVVGDAVVGATDVGRFVGRFVGNFVGNFVGRIDGCLVVGERVGEIVSASTTEEDSLGLVLLLGIPLSMVGAGVIPAALLLLLVLVNTDETAVGQEVDILFGVMIRGLGVGTIVGAASGVATSAALSSFSVNHRRVGEPLLLSLLVVSIKAFVVLATKNDPSGTTFLLVVMLVSSVTRRRRPRSCLLLPMLVLVVLILVPMDPPSTAILVRTIK
jgi:hypothetical protein